MKNLLLYLMLLIAIPATAQSGGLFGGHPHGSHSAEGRHFHGSLMHHGPLDRPYAMNPEDFEAAMNCISQKTFDSDRLEVAKEIVEKNIISAKQIAAICQLFTYDSNRLEFAKYAYAFCTNKGSYFLLDDTFTYRSSRDELHEFIKQ